MKKLNKFNEVYAKLIMEMNGNSEPDIYTYENLENAFATIFPTTNAIDTINLGDLNTFAEIFLNDGGGYDWAIENYGSNINVKELPNILKEYVKIVMNDMKDENEEDWGDAERWIKEYLDNGGKVILN